MSTATLPDQFARTRAAIARFDRYHRRWNREFDRDLSATPSNGSVLCRFQQCENYRKRVVGEAFYADTAKYNSRDTIMNALTYGYSSGATDIPNFIRRVSTGAPREY